MLALDRAYLTAIWLETLFYGMNTMVFAGCMFVLIAKRKTPRVNKTLLATAVMMFIFSSIHVSLGLNRLIEGFIILRDRPGGPAAYFSDVSVPENVAKVCLHTVNSVIGDSIVVWRCYVVWGRNWKVCALPSFLIVASAVTQACGFAQTVFFARATDTHSAFSHELEVWNGSLFGLSLATNILVTLLIALRILYMSRQTKILNEIGVSRQGVFRHWNILTLVIESGMIYSAALICEITLYFLNTNAFYIIYDPIAQLTAIVPTMIIVLAGLRRTTNDVQSRMATTISELPKSTFRPDLPASKDDGLSFINPTQSIPVSRRVSVNNVFPISTQEGNSSVEA